MKIFTEIKWIDMSISFQTFIINNLLISFNKTSLKDILLCNNIKERFTKQSCIVNLYYEGFILKGICISWFFNKYLYLDKFFVLPNNKGFGVGTSMLNEFITRYSNTNKILWRTEDITSKFYLKNTSVIKYFEINLEQERKVYLGTGKINWEYEDLYNLNIKSCFI